MSDLEPVDPADVVLDVLGGDPEIPGDVVVEAVEIARRHPHNGSGCRPGSIAAASVYVAQRRWAVRGGHDFLFTQAAIAELFGVSEVTLRAHRDAAAEVAADG